MSTYVTPAIDTPAKKVVAYSKLAELLQHIQAGTGGYTMDLTSVVFDNVTKIITVILTAQLPNAAQVNRYNLTLTVP